jgi:hypothetical protein
MASALLTATGSTQQLLTINPAIEKTGIFHIYNSGMTEKFNYGDCGTIILDLVLWNNNRYSDLIKDRKSIQLRPTRYFSTGASIMVSPSAHISCPSNAYA